MTQQETIGENQTVWDIVRHALAAAVSLFVNGFGVYLTIHASIGAGPWDVLSIGVSKTFGILYGTASIAISLTILLIDVLLREPIGVSMFIDAVVVGKAVDFFNAIDVVPVPKSLWGSLLMMAAGLFIMGYTQYFYMRAALGCGPRDTLMVGVKRRVKGVPIGVVSIAILTAATVMGWALGGPVGLGTLVCAFGAGPVMQLAFRTVRFDATKVAHQRLRDTARVFARRAS